MTKLPQPAQHGYDTTPLSSPVSWADIEMHIERTTGNRWSGLSQKLTRWLAIACVSVALGGIVISIFSQQLASTAMTVAFFSGMSAFAFFANVSHTKATYTKQVRLSRLAAANGLAFSQRGDGSRHSGMIFHRGQSRMTTDVIYTHPEADLPFEIGQHTYVIGNGKRRQLYCWRYMCLELDRRLPHMVLDSTQNNMSLFGVGISNLPVTLSRDQRVVLEGDFNDHFVLYAPDGYDVDVRYIFTPDLMALLIDRSGSFDAEVIDNKVYFYQATVYSRGIKPFDITFFESVFQIIETVGAKIDRRTGYYADERVGDRSKDMVAHEGQRLRLGVGVTTVFLIIIGIIYALLSVLNSR